MHARTEASSALSAAMAAVTALAGACSRDADGLTRREREAILARYERTRRVAPSDESFARARARRRAAADPHTLPC